MSRKADGMEVPRNRPASASAIHPIFLFHLFIVLVKHLLPLFRISSVSGAHWILFGVRLEATLGEPSSKLAAKMLPFFSSGIP